MKLHMIEDGEFARMDFNSRFNADARFINNLYHQGASAAETWLSQNYNALARRSSINITEMFC